MQVKNQAWAMDRISVLTQVTQTKEVIILVSVKELVQLIKGHSINIITT
jgi:hypothetical protein